MKKSELAERISALEMELLELWSLHNPTEKLLREWVEVAEELRKKVSRLEARQDGIKVHGGSVNTQSAIEAYGRERKVAEEGMCREFEPYLYAGLPDALEARLKYGKLSEQTADVQQQIRDMLVEE